MTLTARNPRLAFTAVSVAAASDRVAFAMTSFWALAAVRSSPPVIGSTFASLPVVWSTMTSENLPPFAVYTESWRTPCSSSNFAEIGLPSRALAARPFTSETLAPLTAFASSVSPFSPYCWAWGCWAWGAVATRKRATRPTNGAIRIFFIASPSAQDFCLSAS